MRELLFTCSAPETPDLRDLLLILTGESARMDKSNYDIEHNVYRHDKHRDKVDETGAVPVENIVVGDSLYARLQRSVGSYGIEQRGIERVPETERSDTNVTKVATMVC